MKLYELTEEYVSIRDRVFDGDESLEDALDKLTGDLEAKIESCAYVCIEFGHEIDAISKEISRLKSRKNAKTNRQDGLMAYMKRQMEFAEAPQIKRSLISISIQGNAPSLKVNVQPEALPEQFQTVRPATITADKNAIKKALISGEEISGCVLVKGTHLRIR